MMWKKILVCFVLIIFGVSENANALGFSAADYFSWTTTSSRIYTANDYWSLNGSDSQGGIYRIGTFTGSGTGIIQYLHLCTNSTIPGNSLIHFNITAILDDKYMPISLNSRDSRMAFLNESFGEYGRSSYLFYLDNSATGCFDFGVAQSNAYWGGNVRFEVSGIDATTLSDEASYSSILNDIKYLNQDQYNRLVDILSQGNGAATQRTTMITNLEDILEEIQGLDIEGSVETALENQREEEKQEIQDTSDEGETAANEAGDTAEDDTATITEQVGSIFEAFDTEATDCVIPLNLGHGVNAGSLNLCSEVPQTVRNLIGYVSTAIVALVVIRLLHTIINTYLEFIESFQR